MTVLPGISCKIMRALLWTVSSLVLLVSTSGTPTDDAIQLINKLGNEMRQQALQRLARESYACMAAATEVRQRSCISSRGLAALQAINTAFFACEDGLRTRALAGGLPVRPAELEDEIRGRLTAEAESVADQKLAAVHQCVQ